MWIKWIWCEVAPDCRDAFHRAQAQWGALAELRGFCWQLGGWDLHRADQALVVAGWRSRDAIADFMRDHHDRIVAASGQESTYVRCVTRLLPATPGQWTRAEWVAATHLRVSVSPVEGQPLTVEWAEADAAFDPRFHLLGLESAWRVLSVNPSD